MRHFLADTFWPDLSVAWMTRRSPSATLAPSFGTSSMTELVTSEMEASSNLDLRRKMIEFWSALLGFAGAEQK